MIRTITLSAIAALSIGFTAAPVAASPLNPSNMACFFKGVGFTGASYCSKVGSRTFMPAEFANSVSSVQVIGSASVSLCTGRVRRGTCKTFTSDTWQIPSPLHNNVKSFQVQNNGASSNVIAAQPLKASFAFSVQR